MSLFYPPDEVIYQMIEDDDPELCEHQGHTWTEAGGGLLMCLVCQAEKWVGRPRRRTVPNSRWRYGKG